MRNITESLEAVVLAKSSSQPNSTYEAAASLSKFELIKILMDKMEEHKSYLRTDYKRKLYDALDRPRDEKKRRKSSKDVESSRDPKSKELSQQALLKEPLTCNISYLASLPMQRSQFIQLMTQECNRIKSLTRYHFEECFKATSERLDWHNAKGKQYPFDLSKPLPLIPDHRVTSLKIMKWYDYGHLDKIEVRREDRELYKLKEGNFLQLHLQDNEDILLLLVQQKLTNLTIERKHFMIKCSITPDLRNRYTYTAYSDPQGVIYKDQNNKNRLMCTDELHKFSDGILNSVRYADDIK
ncbi:hypothetical protein Tco_1283986 [Tanacetum coccineum]